MATHPKKPAQASLYIYNNITQKHGVVSTMCRRSNFKLALQSLYPRSTSASDIYHKSTP